MMIRSSPELKQRLRDGRRWFKALLPFVFVREETVAAFRSAASSEAHALYRALTHTNKAKSPLFFPDWFSWWAVAVLILLGTIAARAQTTVRVQGINKGTTTSSTATVTSVDANHNGLDVNCTSGCSGSAATDATTTGSITTAGADCSVSTNCVTAAIGGSGTVSLQISGAWTGTVQLEETINGSDWFAAFAIPISPLSSGISSATANGRWTLPSGGIANFRVRASALSAGTVSVTFIAGQKQFALAIIDPKISGPDAQAATQTQGPVLQGGRYYTDGTVRTFATDTNGVQQMNVSGLAFSNISGTISAAQCISATSSAAGCVDTASQDFGGSKTVTALNLQCFADRQSGTDMGEKIQACVTFLGSFGGTIDARGFTSGSQQFIGTNAASLALSKHITLLLGPYEITCRQALGANPCVIATATTQIWSMHGYNEVVSPIGATIWDPNGTFSGYFIQIRDVVGTPSVTTSGHSLIDGGVFNCAAVNNGIQIQNQTGVRISNVFLDSCLTAINETNVAAASYTELTQLDHVYIDDPRTRGIYMNVNGGGTSFANQMWTHVGIVLRTCGATAIENDSTANLRGASYMSFVKIWMTSTANGCTMNGIVMGAAMNTVTFDAVNFELNMTGTTPVANCLNFGTTNAPPNIQQYSESGNIACTNSYGVPTATPASGAATPSWLGRFDVRGPQSNWIQNAIVSSSGAINTTETVIVKTPVAIGANRLLAGTTLRATLHGTNTSTAANVSTFRIRIGTAGTTSDGVVCSAATLVAATSGTTIAFRAVIEITIRTTGAAATAMCYMTLDNEGTAADAATVGIATTTTQVIKGTMSTFASTANNFIDVTYVSAATTTTSTFDDAWIEVVYN